MGPELVILVAGESVQRETICHRKRLRTFRQRKAQAQKENVVPPSQTLQNCAQISAEKDAFFGIANFGARNCKIPNCNVNGTSNIVSTCNNLSTCNVVSVCNAQSTCNV